MRKVVSMLAIMISLQANATPSCSTFQSSGPINLRSGGVYSNRIIAAKNTPAILGTNVSNVMISNSIIHYNGAPGVAIQGGSNITLENVLIIDDRAPAAGPDFDPYLDRGLLCLGSPGLVLRNVKFINSSTGADINCDNAQLTDIECDNMRGPFPRGQCVLFENANHGSLTSFYSYNDPQISWPEDNVNAWQSSNIAISGGVIDGNNSINGVGVQADANSSNISVSDVDVFNANNGCFAAYGVGANNVTFSNVRCGNIVNPSPRGAGSSGGVAFIGQPPNGNSSIIFENAIYTSVTNVPFYSGTTLDFVGVSQGNFTSRDKFTFRPPCQ